ncbi:MAG: non-ribosomal peptide synthetase, partial [Candidatus Aminicenantes bacterium]|nr:non-ribosomal peptide synthetase [Candidatus Aminicenantes bacterium]NIM80971.1 non-ribosomal peptide synthetase [Candidatus Aminicenantes bacterium]NIN20353.1 non-ribosomal peptide synthetase [Candidatus Aminicenantes bacterium]NIN44128.1 non-ribosomal peptide synthetase [Candidatus Aminicenantes bacterium]NIN86941.1 non-ribosomal peptide synthetase [Candidatus Aminicenantes bacterium]
FGGSRGAILQKSPPGRRRLYKTGDLARWLADGNIEFLGRIDYQVKIRGFRIELGEIESFLLKHGAIDEAAVIDRETERGEKYLCAYMAPKSGLKAPDIPQLREYLSRHLPSYMIPSYFVTLERLPLTTSGKVNLKALPEPQVKEGEKYLAPDNEIEAALVTIWSEVLVIPPEAISTEANFFELGGHSLKAAVMISKIHRELDVLVPLVELFITPTIRGLTRHIRSTEKLQYDSIEPMEEKEFYPLSSMQKRLYALQQMDKESIGYNIPSVMVVEGTPDVQKMKKVFFRLIQRHESLRTAFELIEEEPMQRILADVEFEIEYYDLATEAGGTRSQKTENTEGKIHHSSFIIHHFVRAFDLSKAPLLRVGLIKLEKMQYILTADMHHIIS